MGRLATIKSGSRTRGFDVNDYRSQRLEELTLNSMP
jgi:hypothetical protein